MLYQVTQIKVLGDKLPGPRCFSHQIFFGALCPLSLLIPEAGKYEDGFSCRKEDLELTGLTARVEQCLWAQDHQTLTEDF